MVILLFIMRVFTVHARVFRVRIIGAWTVFVNLKRMMHRKMRFGPGTGAPPPEGSKHSPQSGHIILVDLQISGRKKNEHDLLQGRVFFKDLTDGVHGHAAGLPDGVAVNPAADGRKAMVASRC